MRRPWAPPSDRSEIAMDRFIGPDPADPRLKGIGPCPKDFHDTFEGAMERNFSKWAWGGNQHAAWAECPKCALRLGYWPTKGRTGYRRLLDEPEVIEAACAAVESLGIPFEKMTLNVMKREIAQAKLDLRKTPTPGKWTFLGGGADEEKGPAAASSTAAAAATAHDEPIDPSMLKKGQLSMQELEASVAELKRDLKQAMRKAAEQEEEKSSSPPVAGSQ